MGGAHAVAALALRHRDVAARRRDRRPRQPVRPGGQAPGLGRVGIDGFAGPSDCSSSPTATPTRGSSRSTCSPRPSTAPEHARGRASDDAALLDAIAAQVAELAATRPTSDAGGVVLGRRRPRGGAGASPRRFAPEHLELVGARGRGASRRACAAPAACSSARASATAFGDYVAGSNHCLPTGGAARFASGLARAHFRRRDERGAHRRRGRGRSRRAGAALARAEGFAVHARVDGGARSRQNRPAVTRAADITRTTGETDVRLALALDGTGAGHARSTGVGFLDHMLDLLARHGRLDLDVDVTRRPRDRRRTTRSRTPGSCSARRSTAGARRPRRDHALRPRRRADGRGARVLRDRHLRPPAARRRAARPPAGRHRRLRARAGRGVLPRGREHRAADAARRRSRPARTPTT